MDLDVIGAPTTFDLALNAGAINLHDHTGVLATFLDEPNVIDLTTEPVTAGLAELAGFGICGTATCSRSASTSRESNSIWVRTRSVCRACCSSG